MKQFSSSLDRQASFTYECAQSSDALCRIRVDGHQVHRRTSTAQRVAFSVMQSSSSQMHFSNCDSRYAMSMDGAAQRAAARRIAVNSAPQRPRAIDWTCHLPMSGLKRGFGLHSVTAVYGESQGFRIVNCNFVRASRFIHYLSVVFAANLSRFD